MKSKLLSLLIVFVLVFCTVPVVFATDSLEVAATYGDTLDSIELPEGYIWKIESPENTYVGNVGDNTFKAICIVEEEKVDVDVVVSVSPALIQEIEVLTEGCDYYIGTPIEPVVKCAFAGKDLVKDVDYTVTYEDNTNIGKAKVVIEGIGNFYGKSQFNFYIIKTDVESVYLDCREIEVAPGTEFNLSATITPSNATFKDVIWETKDEEIATVDAEGKVKALANGSTIISVTTKDGGYVDECVVNVVTHVEKIEITVGSVKLERNDTYILKALLLPWNVNDAQIHWESSDTSVVVVDVNGVITAVSDGVAIITATANDGGFSDECVVVVDTPVMGIDIPESKLVLRSKESVDLDLSISLGMPKDTEVIWYSSNVKVATVDENGKVTAGKIGRATITAYTADGEYWDTCEIRVYNVWWQYIIGIFLFCIRFF